VKSGPLGRKTPAVSLRQVGAIAGAALLLLVALAVGLFVLARPAWAHYQQAYFQDTQLSGSPTIRTLTPTLTGRPELCTTCHIGIEEISAFHPAEAFGCVICHGGDGLALDQARAHQGLRGGRNPSDPSVVQASCGQANCHNGYTGAEHNHVDRVLRSLQATYAGGIALVRYSFGAQPDQAGRYGAIAAYDPAPLTDTLRSLAVMPVSSSADLTPALAAQGVTVSGHPVDTQFRQSCLDGGCHLSEPATAAPYRYRSTGCAACHYVYDDDGRYKGSDPTIAKDEAGHGRIHRLTTAIPFTQCNHCHNRGNYSLKTMTFTPRPDLPPAGAPLSKFMPTQQRRLAEYYQPIGQFTFCEWKLDCVDCHTGEAAMGAGHILDTMGAAQGTECRTCHGTLVELPRTAPITDANEAAMRQARANGHGGFIGVGDRVVVNRLGEKLWAVKQVGPENFVETLKVSGEIAAIPLVKGSACRQNPDEQASSACHECHAYSRDEALHQGMVP
jgi:hypothetical protein